MNQAFIGCKKVLFFQAMDAVASSSFSLHDFFFYSFIKLRLIDTINKQQQQCTKQKRCVTREFVCTIFPHLQFIFNYRFRVKRYCINQIMATNCISLLIFFRLADFECIFCFTFYSTFSNRETWFRFDDSLCNVRAFFQNNFCTQLLQLNL